MQWWNPPAGQFLQQSPAVPELKPAGILPGHCQDIEGDQRGRAFPQELRERCPGAHQAQLQRFEIQTSFGPHHHFTVDNTACWNLLTHGSQHVRKVPAQILALSAVEPRAIRTDQTYCAKTVELHLES